MRLLFHSLLESGRGWQGGGGGGVRLKFDLQGQMGVKGSDVDLNGQGDWRVFKIRQFS